MPSSNTITTFYTFSPSTVIRSARVNNNFDIFRGHILPVDPNTATAAATQTYDLGAQDHRWRNIYGRVVPNIVSTTGAINVATTHDIVLMDTTSATATASLFAVAGNTGASVVIKNIGTGSKTAVLDPNSTEVIFDGGETTTVELIDGESAHLVISGGKWYRI